MIAPAFGHAGLRPSGKVFSHAATLLVLASLDFALPLLMPGDPVIAFLGQDAGIELDAAGRAALLARHGLDQPWWWQYLAHLGRLCQGDLGYSLRHAMPVRELLAEHLPWTLLLVAYALAAALVLGTVLGIEAAFARRRAVDRLLTGATMALDSLPAFALAMALVVVFSHHLGWFPANGAAAPFSTATGGAALAERIHHLVLPASAMALPACAGVFLTARAAAVAALAGAYMDFARAKGAGPLALRYRHLAPNVLAVVLARLGGLGARLVSAAVFAEAVFAYPGINLVLTEAIARHDYPLVRGILLALGLLLFALNMLADAFAAFCARRTGRTA